jgi:hypothetical protein
MNFALVLRYFLVEEKEIMFITFNPFSATGRYIGFSSVGEKCREPIYRLKGILLQSIVQIVRVVIITFILHVICENFITNQFLVHKKNKYIYI